MLYKIFLSISFTLTCYAMGQPRTLADRLRELQNIKDTTTLSDEERQNAQEEYSKLQILLSVHPHKATMPFDGYVITLAPGAE